jgi:hypothetical protein
MKMCWGYELVKWRIWSNQTKNKSTFFYGIPIVIPFVTKIQYGNTLKMWIGLLLSFKILYFFLKVLSKSVSNPKFQNFRATHWFYIQFQRLQICMRELSRELVWRESFLNVFSHEFADFEIEYKINELL